MCIYKYTCTHVYIVKHGSASEETWGLPVTGSSLSNLRAICRSDSVLGLRKLFKEDQQKKVNLPLFTMSTWPHQDAAEIERGCQCVQLLIYTDLEQVVIFDKRYCGLLQVTPSFPVYTEDRKPVLDNNMFLQFYHISLSILWCLFNRFNVDSIKPGNFTWDTEDRKVSDTYIYIYTYIYIEGDRFHGQFKPSSRQLADRKLVWLQSKAKKGWFSLGNETEIPFSLGVFSWPKLEIQSLEHTG